MGDLSATEEILNIFSPDKTITKKVLSTCGSNGISMLLAPTGVTVTIAGDHHKIPVKMSKIADPKYKAKIFEELLNVMNENSGFKSSDAGSVIPDEDDSEVTGDVVQLATATKLGQPVKGSSPGSVYYVVAMGATKTAGLVYKVAARIKTKGVSIRVENYDTELGELLPKIGVENHGTYASVHVSTEDYISSAKVVGAIVMAIPGTKTVVDVYTLFGKGQ